jgi:hypothetical protein
MEHESKHVISNMNFNFDDTGISLHVCSYNVLRGYEQSMARVRRDASLSIGFLYLRNLHQVKMTSFLTYFHVPSLAGARRGAVGSGTALQGSVFDSRCYHLNFSLTEPFLPRYRPGVKSNKNGYLEYLLGGTGGQCVVLTTVPPSYADSVEIWTRQTPGILRVCADLYRNYYAFCCTNTRTNITHSM